MKRGLVFLSSGLINSGRFLDFFSHAKIQATDFPFLMHVPNKAINDSKGMNWGLNGTGPHQIKFKVEI